MTLDTLIAVTALMLAAYQLMPRSRQLDLKLRLHFCDKLVGAASVLLIFYLQFYSVFARINFTPKLGLSRYGLTPQLASFVVFLIGGVIITARFKWAKISPRHLSKLQALVDELVSKDNFAELYSLLDTHLERLVEISKTDERARGLLHGIFTSKEIVASVAKSNPYMALKFFDHDVPGKREFLYKFWWTLLWDPSSALYFEVENNGWTDPRWYIIPETNRLLYYFFHNPKVAEDSSLWRPIGEAMLSQIDKLEHLGERDPYNFPTNRELDGSYAETLLFPGLTLFDIMVSQALRHNIQWHMWLYYLSHMMPKLLRNNVPLENDQVGEFRNAYDRLINEIFSLLIRWVDLIKELPANQNNVVLHSTSPDHENGNIPKSSLITLGLCLDDFLCAEKIHDGFKEQVLHSIYGLYFRLLSFEREDYAEVLLGVLRPSKLYPLHCPSTHAMNLIAAYNSLDKYHHPVEYADRLRAGLDDIERFVHAL